MEQVSVKDFSKNYLFLGILFAAIVVGCIVGAVWPGATALEPLGTVFINIMFCIVVPLVFCSIAGTVANMADLKRAGKLISSTIIIFLVTGMFTCIVMIILMKAYPPVLTPWRGLEAAEDVSRTSIPTLIVNFFTVSDFAGLLSRRAMLPLIVFAMLFGFGVALTGGKDSTVGKLLEDMNKAMLQVVKIVTYYAPIAFFGFFAALVAEYGPQLIGDYGRAMLVYYPLCIVYVLLAFPFYAWLGGGKGAAKMLLSKLPRSAITALGTCSSVATIPTNMSVAEESGVPKDVANVVIPLGATMHMDGTTISGVCKIAFLFGVFGIPFAGAGLFIKVVIVCTFAAVAVSGIPGGGYIGEFIICVVFFPNQLALAYPIAVTIGNLVDPPATLVNSSGDFAVTFLVSRIADGKDWFQKAQARKKAA